jgi:hypothetical protein
VLARTDRFNGYLRLVVVLATVGVVLSVFGVRGGQPPPPPISSVKLTILILTVIAEIVLFAIVPVWIGKAGRDVMSDSALGHVRRCWGSITEKPRDWHVAAERAQVYTQLGTLMFLSGVLMQFIAAS